MSTSVQERILVVIVAAVAVASVVTAARGQASTINVLWSGVIF